MPSPLITLNEEAAALDGRNGFDFLFTTDTPAHGEDDANVSILAFDAPRKMR